MTGRKFLPSFCLVFVLAALLCVFSGRLSPTGPGNIRHLEFVRVCDAQGLATTTGDPDDLLSYEGKADSLHKRFMDPSSRHYGSDGNIMQSLPANSRIRKAARLFLFVVGRSQDWFWLTY